jgi:hypothetical protein
MPAITPAEHPDGIGELQARVDRAAADAGEEDCRDAEREAGDLDLPEHEADGDDDEQEQDRVVSKGLDHYSEDRRRGFPGHRETA